MMQQAAGKMERQQQRGQREQQPAGGGNLHHDPVDQPRLRGLVERLPEQDDDQAGDGSGQIENQPERDFAARHFLQQDRQQHGRNERQRDDEDRIPRGGQQRAPPVGIPQQVGEIVEENPGRRAEDMVVEECHGRATHEGHISPNQDGRRGRQQEQDRRKEPAEIQVPGRGFREACFSRQENPRHLPQGIEHAGEDGQEQHGGRRAAPGEFGGRHDSKHVGIGLLARPDQEFQQLRAARGGVDGKLAGKRKFLGLPDRRRQDVIDDVGVLAVRLGAAVGDGDGLAVAPLGRNRRGDGRIAMRLQQLGRQEAAEAALDEILHADGSGLGRILEADVFPRRVTHQRIGYPREDAHHARIDLRATRDRSDRHRRHAGEVGIEVGEELFVDVGEHHRQLPAAPLERRFRGVLDDIPPAGLAAGIGPRLGRQADVEIQRRGRRR